jgi:hypothetical protein
MAYDFYETENPDKIGLRDPLRREWKGHIIRREDGTWSPESNLNLRFKTQQEAAEAENPAPE